MLEELKQRLLSRIILTQTDCWWYTGAKDSWGYGNLNYQGRQIGAHRASWLAHNGPITNGLHVLHTCDNRGCINPEHLYLGTHQDNMKDRDTRGNNYSGMTRLTETEVREIKKLLATTGRTLEDIGNQFLVTKHAIYDIKSGRTWIHVQ